MKTEQLKEWGLTEEQIKLVFKENGKDIETEKTKITDLYVELENANAKISDYEAKIKGLETVSNDAQKYKSDLETLQKQVDDDKSKREKLENESKYELEMASRFNAVIGDKKWRDELTAKAVYAEFKQSLADEGNKGKGDTEIIEILTKDKNYYDNPNKPSEIPPTGNINMTTESENKLRTVMGLAPKE